MGAAGPRAGPRDARVGGRGVDAYELTERLKAKYPGVKLHITQSPSSYEDPYWTVDAIVVPEGERNAGVGTEIMREIVTEADTEGRIVGLTPSADFGGSKSRLQSFYRRFGFRPNKSGHLRFAIRATMIREPLGSARTKPHLSGNPRREEKAERIRRSRDARHQPRTSGGQFA